VSVREALALGCRVVATAVGHRPPEVTLVQPGLVAPLAEALVQAAGEIAERPQRAESAAAAGGLQPILSLYGVEAACAASAVS
jgi:glycosyltransferase involved in cell wall biosynthesis